MVLFVPFIPSILLIPREAHPTFHLSLLTFNIMKIAVPTRDGHVDDHFGHCAYYTIFEIKEGKIVSRSRLDSPEGCGCKSNIASEMEAMGIELMLAGNMGMGALNKLTSHNIRVIRGCKGDIEAVVEGYLHGFVMDSGISCDHHECHEK